MTNERFSKFMAYPFRFDSDSCWYASVWISSATGADNQPRMIRARIIPPVVDVEDLIKEGSAISTDAVGARNPVWIKVQDLIHLL